MERDQRHQTHKLAAADIHRAPGAAEDADQDQKHAAALHGLVQEVAFRRNRPAPHDDAQSDRHGRDDDQLALPLLAHKVE